MSSPQFTMYSHAGGPNGWKVALLFEELGLTYDTKYMDFGKQEQKSAEHTALNPNGRIPTIIDHKRGDFTLWESNAILQYLVENYDSDHKFGATTSDNKYKLIQWLYFQSSGQGPYFGQAAWFSMFHSEKIPSAIERYKNEIKRVLSVLESVLSKQSFLVEDKYTIADMSFIPWNMFAFTAIIKDDVDVEKEYPATYKWHTGMMEREAVAKVFKIRAEVNAKK